MAKSNPYRARKMLPADSDMFFGRQGEMRRICDMLDGESPQCVSIIGERRIGKSSLANRILHEQKKRGDTIAVYIDCDGLPETCNSKDLFFQYLDRKFSEQAGKFGEVHFNSYSAFKMFIKKRGMEGLKTIIFFDEFEHLPDKVFADDTFFSNLRATANNPDNRLALVTISKTHLENLTHEAIISSEFWNIFESVYIGLLDQKSIVRLRKKGFKGSVSLTDEELANIHYYAGDFPFFNQMACCCVWDAKKERCNVDWNRLEVKLRPHLKKIWDNRTPEEQKLLKDLNGLGTREEFILNGIITRGIVIVEEKSHIPFSGYFSTLIENVFEVRKKRLMDREIVQDIGKGANVIKKVREAIKGD
jgi:hypothetical protein